MLLTTFLRTHRIEKKLHFLNTTNQTINQEMVSEEKKEDSRKMVVIEIMI